MPRYWRLDFYRREVEFVTNYVACDHEIGLSAETLQAMARNYMHLRRHKTVCLTLFSPPKLCATLCVLTHWFRDVPDNYPHRNQSGNPIQEQWRQIHWHCQNADEREVKAMIEVYARILENVEMFYAAGNA